MFFIYRILINLIFIFSPIIFIYRIIKKKEDPSRFKEKLCFFSKRKLRGNTLWFHGASVGEIRSIIPLIEKLEKNKKINQILVTTNTLSSSKILDNLKFKKTIHQFFPIDTYYHTEKFLNYWRPSIAIFVDSEIWPNMLNNAKKRNISLVLLNARITKKTYNRWIKVPNIAKNLFNKFDICLTSSKKSKIYLKKLGAKKILNIGNLKFTQTDKDKNTLKNRLKKKLSSRKIWCASSTHSPEEKICATAHIALKKKYNNLLTIIIPRHVDRSESIMNEMKKNNLRVCLHNSNDTLDKNTDIYLVNSFGVTKAFYKVCKTVFLGGSLIQHGGQNPLEAAIHGCKIINGPNVWNFKEIFDLLYTYKISKKVKNSREITNEIDKTFLLKNNSQKVIFNIKRIGDKILNLTTKEINLLINKNEI